MVAASLAAKTTSTVHAAFVDGTHVFDIDGYSALQALGRSDDVTSGTFHVAGRDWNVVCGFDGGHLAVVSLELAEKEDHHDTVTASVSFSIEDPTVGGRKKKPMRIGSRRSSSSRDDEDDDGQVVHFAHSSRSYKVAVSEAALQKLEARYVVKDKKGGDRLRVRCAVRVFKVHKAGPVRHCFAATAPPADVTGFLKSLLDSGRRSDVTFAVDGSRRFDAHRLVLAARSPVFRAMFFGDTRDSTVAWFRVRDVTAPVFAAMLHFIYTDELPAAAPETEDLLVAADLYGLDRLRLMCEKVLWERVRTDADNGVFGSAISTLALVNGRDSCLRLRKLCVDRVADDWMAATDTAEYRALQTAFPTLHGDVVESVIMKGPPLTPPPMAPVTARSASVYRPSEVRRGRHEMTVVGHSVVRRTYGNGEFVSSGAFDVGGRNWRLLYFPSGWAAGERDASVVLQLLVPPPDAAMHDENNPGFVLAASGTIAVAGGGKEDGETKTKSAIIEHRYTNRKHTAAYRNVCVSGLVGPDDILRVECSFEFVQLSPMAAPSTTTARGRLVPQEEDIVVPPPSVSWHLARLMEDGLGADVTFSVDDGEVEFHAHTMVIRERAPALLLLPSMKTKKDKKKQQKKKTIIRVQGIKAAVFRALLHFVYTDELPPRDDLLLGVAVAAEAGTTNQQQQLSSTATGLAGELLAAAERFHLVERLRPLCENLLCELATPESAADTLQLARRHGRGDLRAFCLDYMTSPGVFKAVADSDGYRALPADALRDIVTHLSSSTSTSSNQLLNTSTSS